MFRVERAVALVRVKKPFLDWINSADGPANLTLEIVNSESQAFLLPEHDTPEELEEIMEDLYKEIFEIELAGYYTNRSCWPEISYERFLDWYDIEVHSMVFDPYKGKIKKEKFY